MATVPGWGLRVLMRSPEVIAMATLRLEENPSTTNPPFKKEIQRRAYELYVQRGSQASQSMSE